MHTFEIYYVYNISTKVLLSTLRYDEVLLNGKAHDRVRTGEGTQHLMQVASVTCKQVQKQQTGW